jgi:hypothetical protein
MARATAHVRSFWKFFHFVNQFPWPARKNGHPVLSSRFLSRVFVITISSHLKKFWYLLYVDKETFNEANLGQDLSFRVSSKTRISSTLIGSFKQGTRVAWELIAVYYHEFKVDEKFMKVGSQQRHNLHISILLMSACMSLASSTGRMVQSNCETTSGPRLQHPENTCSKRWRNDVLVSSRNKASNI